MMCLEVSLNGNVICTAGLSEGHVWADLLIPGSPRSASGKLVVLGATSRPPAFTGSDIAPSLRAAMQSSLKISLVKWIDGQEVNLGDELTIRIVDRMDCEPPRMIRSAS